MIDGLLLLFHCGQIAYDRALRAQLVVALTLSEIPIADGLRTLLESALCRGVYAVCAASISSLSVVSPVTYETEVRVGKGMSAVTFVL